MSSEKSFVKFQYPVLIRESHLDTFGHVNNAAYLQLFEEARWEFITARGYDLAYIKSSGLGPIVLECRLRFLREIRLREKIIIESETLRTERKTAVLRQTMMNEKQQLCCEAEMLFGLFDTRERKLVAPTPEWSRAIGVIEG